MNFSLYILFYPRSSVTSIHSEERRTPPLSHTRLTRSYHASCSARPVHRFPGNRYVYLSEILRRQLILSLSLKGIVGSYRPHPFRFAKPKMADVAEVGDSASIELLDIHDACAHQDNAQIDQNLTPKHALGSDSDTTNTGFPVEPFETPQKAPDPPPSHEKTQDPPKVRSPGLTLPESPAVASTGTPSLGNCMLKTRKAKPNGMSVEQRQKLLQAQRRVKSTIDAREAEAAVSVQSRPHPPAPPNDQVIEPGHGEQNIGFEQKEGSTVNEGEERIKRANKQAEGKDEIGCGAIDSEIKANAGGGSAESDEEAAM